MKKNTKIKKTVSVPSHFVTKEQVKQMLSSRESNLVKFIDTYQNVGSFAGGFHFDKINYPLTSTGASSMSGTSIDIETYDLLYSYTDNSEVATNSSMLRTIIVQAIGDDSTLGDVDILENTSSADAALVSPYSYANFGKTFRVLYDDVVKIDAYNTNVFKRAHFSSKVKRARYDETDSTWSNGRTYIFVVAALHYLSTTVVQNLTLRMNFRDT